MLGPGCFPNTSIPHGAGHCRHFMLLLSYIAYFMYNILKYAIYVCVYVRVRVWCICITYMYSVYLT